MSSTDRHRLIVSAVQDAGQLSVADLAHLTGSSEMTVRRDLDVLVGQGVLERYRGGARCLLLRGAEPPYALRVTEGVAAKRRIAAAVAELIADGESVVLDGGTTCAAVARELRDRRVTVMPLSLHAVRELTDAPGCKLLVPGGEPRPGELSLFGPLTEASLAALRFDTAVIGCCGLSAAEGLTAHDLPDSAIKRAAIGSSRRIIAATDGAKLRRTALAHVVPATALDLVVTDEDAPADEVAALADAGVPVRLV